jgi:hypothetical protein
MHSLSPAILPAYIDAGTGSLLLQLLVGGVLGSLFIIKVFWRNLVSFVGRLFGRKPALPPENAVTEDEAPK